LAGTHHEWWATRAWPPPLKGEGIWDMSVKREKNSLKRSRIILLVLLLVILFFCYCKKQEDPTTSLNGQATVRFQGRESYSDFQDFRREREEIILNSLIDSNTDKFIENCMTVLDSVLSWNKPQDFFQKLSNKERIDRIYFSFEIGNTWESHYSVAIIFSNHNGAYIGRTVMNYPDSIDVKSTNWPEVATILDSLVYSFNISTMESKYCFTAHPQMEALIVYDGDTKYYLVSNCLANDRKSKEWQLVEFLGRNLYE
jgi:hypothetical protein